MIDRARLLIVEGSCKAPTARVEERINATQVLYESQGRIAQEISKINQKSIRYEKEIKDFKNATQIMVSLENVQEDLQALRKDVNQLMGVTPTGQEPPDEIPEAIFDIQEVMTSVIPELTVPPPLSEDPLPENSHPDHPMGSVSLPS